VVPIRFEAAARDVIRGVWKLRGDVCKLPNGDWVSERLGLIDREKFRIRYEAYLRQPANGGQLGIKEIFTTIALELWARRFEK
jgi:hypothetical protein